MFSVNNSKENQIIFFPVFHFHGNVGHFGFYDTHKVHHACNFKTACSNAVESCTQKKNIFCCVYIDNASLEKDNSLNHSRVSPKMGCSEYN